MYVKNNLACDGVADSISGKTLSSECALHSAPFYPPFMSPPTIFLCHKIACLPVLPLSNKNKSFLICYICIILWNI